MHSNLNDLLLNRLDDFKSDGRTLIQVCAVLGFEFSLSDLLIIQSRGKRRMKQKQIEKIEGILSQADKEGILVEMFQGGTENKEDDVTEAFLEKSYMFRHSIWRNCLLGTMLEERKRELHKTIATKLGDDNVEVKDLRVAMKVILYFSGICFFASKFLINSVFLNYLCSCLAIGEIVGNWE